MHEPDPPRPPEPGRPQPHVPPLVWALVLLVSLIALGMSAFVLVAREQVDARVSRAAGDTGLLVTIGDVSFSPFKGLGLRKIHVRDRRSNLMDVTVEEIETDLGIWGLLAGRRRPNHMIIRNTGGRLDSRPEALRDLARRLRPAAAKGGGKGGETRHSALEIEVENLHLKVFEAAGVTGELRSWSGAVTRAESGHVEASARGQVVVDGHTREVTVSAAFNHDDGAELQLSSGGPIGIELPVAGRALSVQFTGVSWKESQEAHRIQGFAVRTGPHAVRCDELEFWGISPTDPDPEQWSKVVCAKGSLTAEGRRLSAAKVTVTRGENAGEILMELDKPRGGAPDYGVDLEAGNMRVALKATQDFRSLLKTGDAQSLLRAVKSLRVTEPRVRATLPDAAHVPTITGGPTGTETVGETLTPGFEGTDAEPPAEADAPTRLAKNLVLPALKPFTLPGGETTTRRLRDLRVEITDGVVDLETADQSESMHIENLALSIIPHGEAGVEATVEAAMQRPGEGSGQFSVTALVDGQGVIHQASGLIAGGDLAHALSRFSDQITVERDAGVKGSFDYVLERSPRLRHRLKSRIELTDFGFQSWRISHTPVSGLSASVDLAAMYDNEDHYLQVDLTSINFGETHLEGAMSLTAPPGGQREIALRLTMPRQDCGALARDIPKDLIPRLEGWELSGTMTFDAQFSLDLDAPRSLRLKVDGDMEKCTAHTLGRHIRLSTLKSPTFVHHPVEPEAGERLDISVGPGTDQWVPLEQLPRFVTSAAVVTEDRAYYFHKGVRWDLVGRAMRMNLEKSRFVYGGSTITQQLVKNLYLTREKTLSRKLEELVISWQVEQTLTKEEILLMYVNLIEYGPNIYGVRSAAHHYFGKPPADLSPSEAAFIMGLKPYPKAGYRQWERQRLKSWWQDRIKKVLEMLYKRERAITKEELEAAAPSYQVRFRKPGESLWGGTPYVSPARTRRLRLPGQGNLPVQDPNAVKDDLLIVP